MVLGLSFTSIKTPVLQGFAPSPLPSSPKLSEIPVDFQHVFIIIHKHSTLPYNYWSNKKLLFAALIKANIPIFYLNKVDKLQKYVCRAVCPTLLTSSTFSLWLKCGQFKSLSFVGDFYQNQLNWLLFLIFVGGLFILSFR